MEAPIRLRSTNVTGVQDPWIEQFGHKVKLY